MGAVTLKTRYDFDGNGTLDSIKLKIQKNDDTSIKVTSTIKLDKP